MVATKNANLQTARDGKKDEFYTQLKDIEHELRHYKHHFKGKTIYCNCDDPQVSNFFKYFSLNFKQLGLKKLISSCYRNADACSRTRGVDETAVWLEYKGEHDDGTIPTADNIAVYEFAGDGDFRSAESIALLEHADIVVTNPPFSLFREYVAQLVAYDKRFLLVGNINAITYKEIFPLLRDDKMWLGYSANMALEFNVPSSYPLTGSTNRVDDSGNKYIKVPGIAWYTNLDTSKRHEDLVLFKKHDVEIYPMYENFEAINVNKVVDIPVDYSGLIGVPITFLAKHNPSQFDIVGIGIAGLGKEIGIRPFTPEHKAYRRNVQKRGAVDGDLYMMVDGEVTVPYRRIIIRRKQQVIHESAVLNPYTSKDKKENTI